MSEPWLKKAEVARELQVSERTVTRHIRPSGIVGGQNRYLMSDVRRQIARGVWIGSNPRQGG